MTSRINRRGFLGVAGASTVVPRHVRGGDPVLYAGGESKPLFGKKPDEEKRESSTDAWVDSFLTGNESPGTFLSTGAISDAHNLGTVALRARKKVLFDSASMKITNDAAANKYLYRKYRKGWNL